jgi:divalent metal cation (Fe/Co/Zn/Cd) transporter
VYLSVSYNIVEAMVSITAGAAAGSTALVGFGLDSVIESLSAMIMVWRFVLPGQVTAKHKEHIAVRMVAATFFIFGTYVLIASVIALVRQEAPEESIVGILVALASILFMPLLYHLKRTTGEQMGSESLVADAKQTLACSLMSVTLLISLGANYLFDIWQLDALAGIAIALWLWKEGIETWKNKEVCTC